MSNLNQFYPDDDVLPELSQTASQGFIHVENDDDPFATTATAVSSNKLMTVTDLQTTDPSTVTDSQEKKSKIFKILKLPKNNSMDSTESGYADPEEEKLKMLPDCCELTSRKNDAYEVDDTRKEMSSVWFNRIVLNAALRKYLCFSESLLMVEENGTVVGKMYSSVTPSKWGDKQCLCVHSGSFGKFSTGLESGTTITSFVNFKMQPLQEFVHEWATLDSETIERKTFIFSDGDKLSCKITTSRNDRTYDTKNLTLGVKERENLVTEATNILLQRILIRERRTNGSMLLQCLSYTGKVVRAKYSELGSGWENVKGKQMKTWGIRRTVTISCDEERQWDCLFNKFSRLILRCQPDSPQALIPLWFESVVEFDKYGNFTGIYPPYAWACDMELYSKYSIKKEEITHEHRRYILDHPEVTALLSDYLQAVLFRKPQDVIEFTKQYFSSFLNLQAKTAAKASAPRDASSFGSTSYDYGSPSRAGSDQDDEEDANDGEWAGEGDGYFGDFMNVNEFGEIDGEGATMPSTPPPANFYISELELNE